MNSRKVLYSSGNNDECYTPAYAVIPLLEFLPKDKIIWCPFDTEKSEFVKVLKENGYNIVFSHIDNGQDFYNYEPDNWDIIVSNPPFTNKRKIFERVLSFNKPFALLMSLTWLNDAAPKQLFFEKDLQLLMFDKRIKFIGMGNKITFSSAYYCWNLLPKQIIMKQNKGE
ncbi:MAG: tRNA (adenine-N(6)-)-methyltransferase [Clostridia bacterium]|nr:tRNA (adenine-N(6)-)-methyltransferase [Clostridia bacterium]